MGRPGPRPRPFSGIQSITNLGGLELGNEEFLIPYIVKYGILLHAPAWAISIGRYVTHERLSEEIKRKLTPICWHCQSKALCYVLLSMTQVCFNNMDQQVSLIYNGCLTDAVCIFEV